MKIKSWKIWASVGTIVTATATIGYTFAPIEYKILIDNALTVIKPIIEGLPQ